MSGSKRAMEWTPQDVATLLNGMGLTVHAARFIEEGINGQVLLALTSEELKYELGITKLGERKQLLQVIGELATSTIPSYPPGVFRSPLNSDADASCRPRTIRPPGCFHITEAVVSAMEEQRISKIASPQGVAPARQWVCGRLEEPGDAYPRAVSTEASTTGSTRSYPEAPASEHETSEHGALQQSADCQPHNFDGSSSSSQSRCFEARRRFRPFFSNTWRSIRFGVLGMEGVEEAGGHDYFVNVTWPSGSGSIQLDGQSMYFHIYQSAYGELARCTLKFRPTESCPTGPVVWGEGQDREIWHLEPPPPPPPRADGWTPRDHLHQSTGRSSSPPPPPPPPVPAAVRWCASEHTRLEVPQPPSQPLRASPSDLRCPTPGCPYPARGAGSATHCCMRCELAHRYGGHLWEDPVTGERWKQPHGPSCTKHCGGYHT